MTKPKVNADEIDAWYQSAFSDVSGIIVAARPVGRSSGERGHDRRPLVDGTAHRGVRSVSHLPSEADPIEAGFEQEKERTRK